MACKQHIQLSLLVENRVTEMVRNQHSCRHLIRNVDSKVVNVSILKYFSKTVCLSADRNGVSGLNGLRDNQVERLVA